jgi:hypothetical protein
MEDRTDVSSTQPCGQRSDPTTVGVWHADAGRCPGELADGPGVCVLTEPSDDYAARVFTFEAWLTWPAAVTRGRRTIAEARGGDWWWRLLFNPVGGLEFVWRCGDYEKAYITEPMLDALEPGQWYHLALLFNDKCYTKEPYVDEGSSAIHLTPAGDAWPRCVAKFGGFQTPGPGPTAPAALAVGRGIDNAEPADIRIASAAFHRTSRSPGDFPALGGHPLAQGLSVHDDFEFASLGRAFTNPGCGRDDAIIFTPQPRMEGGNYWWAFRLRGAAGRVVRFHHPASSAMALTAFISEDGGATWRRPNHGIWRDRGDLLAQSLTFAHRFATDDAIVAASPIVNTAMIERWIADVRQRFAARVHTLATTPDGKPVRAVEVGNPDAPMVYMQSGQHSMMERIGLHIAAEAFELAAADDDLMRRSRWVLVPVVNMDSYAVQPRADDRNMNRLWGRAAGHHTVDPMSDWIAAETARTGAPLLLDFHSGVTWRGHYALASPHPDNARLRKHLEYAGLDYTFALERLPRGGTSGVFSDWAASLPGAGPSLTVELSVVAAMTPNGPAPVLIDHLRDDGRRWKQAIAAFVSA